EVEPLVIGDGFDRSTSRDGTQERQSIGRRPMTNELNGPRREAFAQDESFLFQSFQVAHDSIRRSDAEGLSDLAHRRTVAARLDLAFDEVVNLALAIGQLAEVRHFPPLCTEKPREW